MKRPIFLGLAAAALLAGCHGKKTDATGAASGTVLPGEASDAMLPLDTLRSQPPPAAPGEGKEAEKEAGKSKKGHKASAKATAEPGEASPAADAAEPAPAASE